MTLPITPNLCNVGFSMQIRSDCPELCGTHLARRTADAVLSRYVISSVRGLNRQ